MTMKNLKRFLDTSKGFVKVYKRSYDIEKFKPIIITQEIKLIKESVQKYKP